MRGSLHSQVEGLYHSTAKGIGVSRHEMKKSRVKDTLIHSDTTRVAYLRVWHRIVKYAARHHNVTQINQLTSDIVCAWLEIQVGKSLAPDTIGQYCSAVMKLQDSLNNQKEKEKAHVV